MYVGSTLLKLNNTTLLATYLPIVSLLDVTVSVQLLVIHYEVPVIEQYIYIRSLLNQLLYYNSQHHIVKPVQYNTLGPIY